MADADGTPAEPEREPLTAAPCAWLTTLRRDGSAHVTPVWFLHDPGTFWIASSTVNVKVANIRRDPRVVLAIDGSGPRPVVAQGRARVHHDIGSYPTLLARFAGKYGGWDAADPRQDGPRVLLEVQVDRWLLGPGTAR
ncbi:TIGR03618 family F420-dependent PPOX class oxidoreductase [Cellulomonas sp. KH9]|uniref:TIGR03618 family F420-dependent PPOX class oxidoreductase n=1 Tax=Cellulomonas sp. KH9 TaxID=1855324 RepID=UPI0008EB66C5|nr:TIGR03618 family F420-dependent PPOX class oxidoreductase [Cellulomonas sp. KH9]SFK03227.1 PPOX class probable F420-dependent enzyme [Cellulomonas sp. KH9]